MDERLQRLLYPALAAIIMVPLMASGYYLTLDMQFGPNSFSNFQFSDFYGFAPSSYGAYFPLRMVMAALSTAISVEIIEKLLIFSIFAICGLSMHLALPRELGSSRLYGGLLYMINPFIFIRFLAGHWALLLSYSLWPLAAKWFLDFLDGPRDNRNFAKVALITSAAAISSHGVIMLLIAYALIFCFHAAANKKAAGLLKPSLILALTVLAINLYWIAPTALLFGETYKPASADAYLEDFGPTDRSLPVEAAILTMHGFWRGGFSQTKDVFPQWPYVFIILLLLSVAGAFFLYRQKPRLLGAMIAVFFAGFLLALGASGPLLWAFTLLGERVPIYMLFRDSQKFVGLMCLAYSYLGAFGLNGIRRMLPRISTPALCIAIAAVLLYDFSIYGFQGQVGISQYPEDWYGADRVIAADPTPSYILVIPPYLYNSYPWVMSVQKTLGTPASQFFSKPVITSSAVITSNVYGDTSDSWGDYVEYLFQRRQFVNDTADILAPLNIRYILLYKPYENSDHYLWLFKRKGGVHDIELVYEGDTLCLFRNNLARGPISGSEDPGLGGYRKIIDSGGVNLTYPDPAFAKSNPSMYFIGPSNSTYIVISIPAGAYMEYNGQPASEWHKIGSVFINTGPGTIVNRMSYLVLALFSLSWALALALLLGSARHILIGLSAFAASIFILASYGILLPVHLGAILAACAIAGLLVFNNGSFRS